MVRNSTRFITTAKIPVDKLDDRKHNISFIILAATQNTKINSRLPVPLLSVGDTTLIDKQHIAIKSIYPNSEIFLGTGYKSDDVYKHVAGRIKIVENERYNSTGATRTLSLVLKAINNEKVVIIDGNILFDIDAIYNLEPSQSMVFTTTRSSKDKIGVIATNNIVTDFNYGSTYKWCKISYFCGEAIQQLHKIVHTKTNEHMCLFESMELALKNGLVIRNVTNDSMKFKEIDSMSDIKDLKNNGY